MRAMLAVLMVAMCLMPLPLLLPRTASAVTFPPFEVTSFADGQGNVTIDFASPGTDSSAGISLQAGVNVNSCTVKVNALVQAPGATTGPSDVAIDFGGDSQFEWKFTGPGVGGLGLQSVFMDNKTTRTYEFPWTGGADQSPIIRLPKTAQVTSAGMNVSFVPTGTAGKILLMYCEVPTYSWWNDLVTKLQTYPDFTTIDVMNVNNQTPSINTLLGYSAVMVWSDYNYSYPFFNPSALGDALAAYIDAGGAVVLGDYAMYSTGAYSLGGRFSTGGYYCIQPSASLAPVENATLGSVSQPGHAVMAGLSNVSFPNGTVLVATGAAPGASPIAYYDNGFILAANRTINGVNRADLNFWPVPWGNTATCGFGGDMDKLVRNALVYSGARSAAVKVDVIGDGTAEYQSTGLQGSAALPDFSSALNQYIAGASPSLSDQYGNSFVDIPVNVSSPGLASLRLENLKIAYSFSAAIGPNPATGNLTLAVAALVPEQQGSQKANIPIYISSSTTGSLGMDSLDIWLTPPFHSPTVKSFFPEQNTTIYENTRLDLGVTVTDMYANPFAITWFLDGATIEGTDVNNSVMFDYSSAGMHAVAAMADNGIKATTVEWAITVLDMNRAPQLTDYDPELEVLDIKEGGHQNFSVEAQDPDGDPLSYVWTVDGNLQASAKTSVFTYFSDFFANGTHKIAATVHDTGNGSASTTWTVRVENINQPPEIKDWSPREKISIIETQAVGFTVTAVETDNQTMTINWTVDDQTGGTGSTFEYRTDYRSAGNHTVKVAVSDGTLTVTREWPVTVLNLNRLPVAIIDQPLEGSEYKEGDPVRLGANSSYDPDQDDQISFNWKEGSVNISDKMNFEMPFTHGIHTLVLEVRDRNGGISQATVHFKVLWTEISTVISTDPTEIAAGTKLDIIVTMSNVGDVDSEDMTLEVLVDGKSISSKTVPGLSAGGSTKQLFQWKATKGTHSITAKIGDQTWNKAITVDAAPAAPPSTAAQDALPFILIIIVAVILVAWGWWALGRK